MTSNQYWSYLIKFDLWLQIQEAKRGDPTPKNAKSRREAVIEVAAVQVVLRQAVQREAEAEDLNHVKKDQDIKAGTREESLKR